MQNIGIRKLQPERNPTDVLGVRRGDVLQDNTKRETKQGPKGQRTEGQENRNRGRKGTKHAELDSLLQKP